MQYKQSIFTYKGSYMNTPETPTLNTIYFMDVETSRTSEEENSSSWKTQSIVLSPDEMSAILTYKNKDTGVVAKVRYEMVNG